MAEENRVCPPRVASPKSVEQELHDAEVSLTDGSGTGRTSRTTQRSQRRGRKNNKNDEKSSTSAEVDKFEKITSSSRQNKSHELPPLTSTPMAQNRTAPCQTSESPIKKRRLVKGKPPISSDSSSSEEEQREIPKLTSATVEKSHSEVGECSRTPSSNSMQPTKRPRVSSPSTDDAQSPPGRRSRSRTRQPRQKKRKVSQVAPSTSAATKTFAESCNSSVNSLNRSHSLDSPSGATRNSGKSPRESPRAHSADSGHHRRSDRSREEEDDDLVPPEVDVQPPTLAEIKRNLIIFYTSLSRKMDQIKSKQLETEGTLANMMKIIGNNTYDMIPDEKEDDQNDENAIKLPVDTKVDFDRLESRLLQDEAYRKKTQRRIFNLLSQDVKVLKTHCVSQLIRPFVTKEVLRSNFTPLQPTKSKAAFTETNLYKTIAGVYLHVYKNKTTAKQLQELLQAAFNSARDWDGGRATRMSQ